jgi:ABC-type uncharacterized transport system auxiliary subunit
MSAPIGRGWLLATMLASVSCGGLPKTRYYTLEYPHVSHGRTPVIARHIMIQRFKADQVLLDDRIVYRENPNEVNFYEYQRWASPPADLVTHYFLHRLRDAGTYARVSAYNEGAQSDYTFQGRVHHFEEVDRGKEVFVSVALEAELIETKTRASVWRGEASCERPVATREMSGIVSEIYECLNETATKLLTSMQSSIEAKN